MPAQTPAFDFACLLDHLGSVRTRFDVAHIESCESTNTLMLERAARGYPCGSALVADIQHAGRGRRGRSWHSAQGSSLTFSLLWRFGPRTLPAGLSLAVGVAIAQALEGLGVHGVGLKWPNDLWLHDAKLGGVLVEVAYDSDGLGVIIGIGLNLRRDTQWSEKLDRPYAALEDAECNLPREAVLAALLCSLAPALDLFEREGFAPLRSAWAHRNALYGLPVCVRSENGEHRGICGNVNTDGALELQLACGAHLLVAGGDVSLLLAPMTNGRGS